MFETLLCHGTSVESRIIEDVERGPGSHIRKRFLRDFSGLNAAGEPVNIKAGECVEAWNSGVRKVASWDVDYAAGTVIEVFSARDPFSEEDFETAARFLCRQIGKPYDWPGCKRLIPGAQHLIAAPDPNLSLWNHDAWFCSKLDAASWEVIGKPCFNRWRPWDLSPEALVNSLRYDAKPLTLIVP